MDPQSVIEQQVNTYNARDLEGYMKLFHEDVEIFDYPGVLTLKGRAEVHARYASLFEEFPENFTEIIHRIVLDHRVIDHEIVYREGRNALGLEMVAIYEVQGGMITRIDFLRKSP